MTDSPDRLASSCELLDQATSVLVNTQGIRIDGATGDDEQVVIGSLGVGKPGISVHLGRPILVAGDGLNGLAAVGGDGYLDAGLCEGVEGLDKLGLLDSEVGDGDKCACSHGGSSFNRFQWWNKTKG